MEMEHGMGMERGKTFRETMGPERIGRIIVREEGRKPAYLASMDTTDPYTLALANAIFWTDQLAEHSKFMEMLLPIEDLPAQHEQAVKFRGVFEMLHERAMNIEIEEGAVRELSNEAISQTELLVKFKRDLIDQQATGKIHSLLWPTFLDHIAREGERFVKQQKMFMDGKYEFDREEIIDFWSKIMWEHAAFIAHLLDPEEVDLINQALDENVKFKQIQKEHPLEAQTDPVPLDVDHTIDFKMAAVKGIEAAEIKSIITPELADHVRREAVFFSNELRMADMIANITPKAA
ncbi:MAG: DUF2935 domain-containing protein [Actinobacteria bacterium]|nr:DUF2935 domain-containing protein [Actinomycetota bacterium]